MDDDKRVDRGRDDPLVRVYCTAFLFLFLLHTSTSLLLLLLLPLLLLLLLLQKGG